MSVVRISPWPSVCADTPLYSMPRTPRETKVLLAPLTLYRHILRAHRCLPAAMRSMGDDYVKSEFRRHQKIDNPAHIVGFISEWQG